MKAPLKRFKRIPLNLTACKQKQLVNFMEVVNVFVTEDISLPNFLWPQRMVAWNTNGIKAEAERLRTAG